MRIRATFIGADKSMGFRAGRNYELQVLSSDEGKVYGSPRIVACEPPVSGIVDGKSECPYGSWRAFWRNWNRTA